MSAMQFPLLLCSVLLILASTLKSCRQLISSSTTDRESAITWSNIEDFSITDLIGSGTFGEAYLGHSLISQENFLFKIYKFGKQSIRKMNREITVAQHLCGHPNIVRLHHVVKQGLTGYPILLFDFVNSTKYHELYPTLAPNDAVFYLYELLKGLAFAHGRNVVHKDLKPANVVFDKEKGKVKIIDWGLSEFHNPGDQHSVSGTTQYMAPELLLGYRYSSYSADMWAYGCILGALIFRDTILFPGHGKINQLHTIARIALAEETCNIVAYLREEPRANGTTSPLKKKNYNNVELFWSNADDFVITKRLGSGAYGEAYLGNHVRTLQPYVVKVYRFGKLKKKKMLREILVTQSICGHPNIIRLEHVIRQSLTDYPALVFEYAKDTYYRTLYPVLVPEDVQYYMYEVLKGLAFAHSKGVMHKDLKPTNIMIDHEARKLKIIDWGLSQFYIQKQSQSVSGSLFYKSPEMLLQYAYADYSTDIWSVGCIFAALLYRKLIYFSSPVDTSKDQLLLIAKTLGTDDLVSYAHKYQMHLNETLLAHKYPKVSWERLVTPASRHFSTPDALDLLNHMLVYDHEKRISAKDALQHPYFRSLRTSSSSSSSSSSSADGSAPTGT